MNLNIGCIETNDRVGKLANGVRMNLNIGCIETSLNQHENLYQYGMNLNIGCIETNSVRIHQTKSTLDEP